MFANLKLTPDKLKDALPFGHAYQTKVLLWFIQNSQGCKQSSSNVCPQTISPGTTIPNPLAVPKVHLRSPGAINFRGTQTSSLGATVADKTFCLRHVHVHCTCALLGEG